MDKIIYWKKDQNNSFSCDSGKVTNVSSFISKSEFETGDIKQKTFAEKLRLVANTIRNHRGIQQIKNTMYNGGNKMCVLGLLGFRSGIVKDDLMTTSHVDILGKYGMTEEEILTELPIHAYWQDKLLLKIPLKDLFILNDIGWAFDQIADYLDDCADKLC